MPLQSISRQENETSIKKLSLRSRFIKNRGSKISVNTEFLVFFGIHHSSFLVLSNTSLEEVRLSLEGNHLHPIERILAVVDLVDPQSHEESVGHALDILDHELHKEKNTLLLMPIRSLGRLSEMNFFSMVTASRIISWISSGLSLFLSREYI